MTQRVEVWLERARSIAAALLLVATLAPLFAGAVPRLAPLAANEGDAAARTVIERFAAIGMRNAVATYARYPELATAMLPYTEFLLTKSALPARHRELLWLRTAWLARSEYVWAQRAAAARRAGLGDADLLRIALGPDAPGWDPFEAVLLRAADELRVDAFISDATWNALAARYDESQLIDLLFGVGELTMHADFANTLGLEIEAELADRLPAGVAYAPAARQTSLRLVGRTPRIEPLPSSGAGPSGNVFQTFARNPPADALRNAQGAHVRGANTLTPRNRQLVIMRVGVLMRSEYEWAAHSRGGRQVGMNDADVARVAAGPGAPGGTPLETLLMRAVDDLYRDNAIDDATWDALARDLSVRQLLDVMFTAGAYRSVSYALNSSGVQLDENMADFRFPPELRSQVAPLAKPTVPPGFAVTVFAEGLATPRHIAVRDNGDVYVTLRSGQAKFRPTDEPGGIVALRDTNGDGVADVQARFGSPDIDTGLAIRGDELFYASTTTIYSVALDEELVPTAARTVAVAELPESGSGHRSKPITFDDAGHLITQVGAPSNACQRDAGTPGSPGLSPCTLLEQHGGVFLFDADTRNQHGVRDAERYTTGHRNLVALEWNASAGALFGLMHARDGLSELWPEHYSEQQDIELPAEEFHRLDRGVNLGWPYTYYDPKRRERMVMPEYGGDGNTPAEPGRYRDPLIAFPAHWAPNDLVFYEAAQFPERYRHGAFIAFHGAVTPRGADVGGYNVVFVPMSSAGAVAGEWEIFADDFEHVQGGANLPARPSGLAIGPDGALYIGDDSGGRVFKVTYGK